MDIITDYCLDLPSTHTYSYNSSGLMSLLTNDGLQDRMILLSGKYVTVPAEQSSEYSSSDDERSEMDTAEKNLN